MNRGAHLQKSNQELGELLTHLARRGDTEKLGCYQLAGAGMATRNLSGSTPLHAAAETGQAKTVEFLLEAGAKAHLYNAQGQTAEDLARAYKRKRCLYRFRIV